MDAQIPTLAIVGHPNAGKSSVVATLTENDRIAIDKRAGTTTRSDQYPVEIDGKTVLRFVDTPGFQNPTDILEWFQQHPSDTDLARAFVEAHRHDHLYSHDCALMKPIAEGAGIILVVDGSKRIKEKDRTEMELLRLTGRPRMAIFNNLSANDKYIAAWQDALNKSFNSVRMFNAHRATYAERIALLNALKTIDQRWEPMLDETVRAFERDWERRIEQSVTSILKLLRKALTYKVVKIIKTNDLDSDQDREQIRQRLTEGLQEGLRTLEHEAQAEIREHFKHHVWNVSPSSLLVKDLFSNEVESRLGLNRHQTVLASAAAGAATGGALDLGIGGLSFGAGTLIGASIGGVLGVLGTSQLAKLDIKRTLGVERFTLGPVSNPRFPFILLDRSILYCARAMNWAHGRQAADENAPNRVPDQSAKVPRGFAEALDSEDHKTLAKFFAAARKGKDCPQEQRVREIIHGLLRDLSTDKIDSRADL
ncbi:MAG: GTPase/DUF3482 domain-containing protein [Halochromatium sp.]|uniref:GTPase/DUF3482 domain-containing protein n=1 Tax=Halochromatium sp. TaxID=2049430 RepID=UPI0039797ABD